MKKPISKTNLVIIFLFFFSIVFSQKNYSDAKVIYPNNDTIDCKIGINYNFLNKKYLDDAAYFQGVTIVNEDGSTVEKIPAKYIKQVSFFDIFGIERIYLNNGVYFKQLLFNGSKIKWLRTMTYELFDGPKFKEYLIDNEGKITNLELFYIKKRLKEATVSKPEIVQEINKISIWKYGDKDVLNILKKYEE